MDIKQDVIIDLLPAYFDGRTSDDSNALIEAYFDENPNFAKSMQRMYQEIKSTVETDLKDNIEVTVDPEEKMRVLQRTKFLLRLRTGLLIAGVLAILVPLMLATFISGEQIEWVKGFVIICWAVVAPVIWGSYFYIRYRMRGAGDW